MSGEMNRGMDGEVDVHMQYTPTKITFWDIKQTLTNIKELEVKQSLPYYPEVKEEVTRETQEHSELNENVNTTS